VKRFRQRTVCEPRPRSTQAAPSHRPDIAPPMGDISSEPNASKGSFSGMMPPFKAHEAPQGILPTSGLLRYPERKLAEGTKA